MSVRRCLPVVVLCALLTAVAPAWADAFDRYTNFILAKAPEAAGVQVVTELTPEIISGNDSVLPGTTGALLIVKTTDGRWAKLLVQPAFQKANGKQLPILLIDRFVTYKEGQARAVQASGQNIHLYEGFRFSLDLGQVVPAELGGDLRLVVDRKAGSYVAPVGQAKVYLITKPLPGTEPPKTAKLIVGETFEPRYFNGTYKLYDDGRRSGLLKLMVDKDGEVTGSYFSDKDGQKYDVNGKLGSPKHAFQFTIKFPRTEQVFQGWMFTGDAKAFTGFSRLQERETGFYAVRVEGE
jgi:hypothetical protein